MTNLNELKKQVKDFYDERGWDDWSKRHFDEDFQEWCKGGFLLVYARDLGYQEADSQLTSEELKMHSSQRSQEARQKAHQMAEAKKAQFRQKYGDLAGEYE